MKVDEKITGLILVIIGICLVTGGFSLIHGLAGALISSGVMVCIWGMVLCTDE